MLAEELPDARLVEANSILEWRLTPGAAQRRAGALPRRGLRRAQQRRRARRAPPATSAGLGPEASATLTRRMATRKEEKERLRAAAAARPSRRGGRRSDSALILGYVVAGVLTAGGARRDRDRDRESVAGSAGSEDAARPPTSTPRRGSSNGVAPDAATGTPPPPVADLDLKTAAKRGRLRPAARTSRDEGNKHVAPGTNITYYRTNPPTSGNHSTPFQQADGAYSEEPDSIDFVHSLEHGRIEIQYAPDLPEQDQLALKGVFDESPPGMLLFPNRRCPTRSRPPPGPSCMGCKNYEGAKTLDAIRDFRDPYRGRGPEPQVPITP